MYQFAYDNNDIIIRFKKKSVNKKLLENFLEHLELDQMRNKSELTDQQAKKLAKEITRKVWNNLKKSVLAINLKKINPILSIQILFILHF